MPKKKKTLTKVLYTYVTQTNRVWVKKEAKRQKMAYSAYLNSLIDKARVNTRTL